MQRIYLSEELNIEDFDKIEKAINRINQYEANLKKTKSYF